MQAEVNGGSKPLTFRQHKHLNAMSDCVVLQNIYLFNFPREFHKCIDLAACAGTRCSLFAWSANTGQISLQHKVKTKVYVHKLFNG